MLSNVVLIKSGTDEENERANQRMIDCLTEEKKKQHLKHKAELIKEKINVR